MTTTNNGPKVPLLAPSQTLTRETARNIKYRKLVSPKYDGIRATIQSGLMLSRTLKQLPNQHMANLLAPYADFDGEIVCGSPTMDGGFNHTQSVVMGNLPCDDWKFYVFDIIGDPRPFEQRVQLIADRLHDHCPHFIEIVPEISAYSADDLLALEEHHREAGWEGVMVRDPHGLYPQKHSGELRCTVLQENVLKFKHFEDSEGLIVGLYEGETNNNPAFKDERGLTKRSTHKAGMVKNGICGGFVVKDEKFGWTCDVAPGKFTKAQLQYIWEHQDEFIGKRTLKYQFQLKGRMDLPRFPTGIGFRDNQE